MGVCTVTIVKVWADGDRKHVVADVAPNSSYATGGDTLSGTELLLETELTEVKCPAMNIAGDRLYSYDHANLKLKIFTALSTEAVAATNQSTKTVRVTAFGKGTASGAAS